MSDSERSAVQYNLSGYGYYTGEPDGVYGPGTERALLDSLDGKYFQQVDVTDLDGARIYLSSLLGLINEGDECDGCEIDDEAVATTEQPDSAVSQSDVDFFLSQNIQCKPVTDSPVWAGLGGSYRLSRQMSEFDQSSDPNSDEIFYFYKSSLQENPDYPPLLFKTGYGYWLRNDFRNAVPLLAKAAAKGEPNSAYLLSVLAMNVLHPNDKIKISGQTPAGPIDIKIAVQCLEVAASTGTLDVDGGTFHDEYFSVIASQALVALYLQRVDLLGYQRTQDNYTVNWQGLEKKPVEALQLIQYIRSNPERASCDSICLQEMEKIANEEVQKLTNAKAAEDEEARLALSLSEAEVAGLNEKCSTFTSLKGLCWGLSSDEMKAMMATKGYNCSETANLLMGKGQECTKGEEVISIFQDTMVFGCQALNTCNYSFKEVSQMLVDNGVISSLDYDNRVADPDNPYLVEQYCGRGSSGDELCVVKDKNIFRQDTVFVYLSRGASENSAPSFD